MTAYSKMDEGAATSSTEPSGAAALTESVESVEAELEALNAELRAFAHTAAHQLRLPLSGILLTAQMLDEDCDLLSSEDLHRDLKAIVSTATKMGNIIDDLLLLSRARDRSVDIQPVDMGPIVSDVLKRLAPIIAASHADVRVPDHWPGAMGYGPWIEEMWVNYISNAVKYGGSPPRIELGAAVQPDGTICFTVKDNGAGLKAEERGQLFLPFRRVGKSLTDGNGLGLSIVRRITERLKGHVVVESVEGQGSIFGFTLNAVP